MIKRFFAIDIIFYGRKTLFKFSFEYTHDSTIIIAVLEQYLILEFPGKDSYYLYTIYILFNMEKASKRNNIRPLLFSL